MRDWGEDGAIAAHAPLPQAGGCRLLGVIAAHAPLPRSGGCGSRGAIAAHAPLPQILGLAGGAGTAQDLWERRVRRDIATPPQCA